MVPSAPSRGPLCFFLAPNIALKGLFVVFGIFLQDSAYSGNQPPEIIFINSHHASSFTFNSFPSSGCPFPTGAHQRDPGQLHSHMKLCRQSLFLAMRLLCNRVVRIFLMEKNLSFIFCYMVFGQKNNIHLSSKCLKLISDNLWSMLF